MKKIFLPLLATALLTGCSTTPVSNDKAKLVSGNKIHDQRFVTPAPDTSEITIKRDSGLSGSGCTAHVFVNTTAVADLDPSEKVVLYLPEGTFILSTRTYGICGGGIVETTAVVKKGVPMSFRIALPANGDYTLSQTAF